MLMSHVSTKHYISMVSKGLYILCSIRRDDRDTITQKLIDITIIIIHIIDVMYYSC